MVNNKDELAHVGVMGMRWGRRKGSSSLPSTNTRTQAVSNVGKKLAKKGTPKKQPRPFGKPEGMTPKRLTDVQLRARINRIEMDNKFALLTAKKVNPAKKIIMDILMKSAQTTAQTYVTKMMGKGMANIVGNSLDVAPPAPPTPSS